MQANVIQHWHEVSSLSAEWNTLLRSSRANNLFLTWEWIRTWQEVVGHAYEPFVITLHDASGKLCAIAPFYVQTHSLCGVFKCRALRIMGDFPTSAEYPDWIVQEGCEEQAVEEIYRVLKQYGDTWDYVWMPNVSAWTAAPQRIAGKCDQFGVYCNTRSIQFSAFDLPATVEAHWNGMTSKRRKELRHQSKLVLARPGVRITRCTTTAELPDYLEALFRLHGQRRRTLGDQGSFARRPAQAQFYRRFAPVALEQGWLRLYALKEGGAYRAVQMGYVYGGVFLGIQDGLDPGFVPGAGNVLRLEVVKGCIAEGVRTYDFLGGYSEHKRRWGAQQREGFDLMIGQPNLVNSLLFAGQVWPTGRFLRPVHSTTPPLEGFDPVPGRSTAT